jgi:predicted acyl esterase
VKGAIAAVSAIVLKFKAMIDRMRRDLDAPEVPGVAANPNTGNPVATDTESRVAHQRVHHRRGAASHIVLPVMPSRTN